LIDEFYDPFLTHSEAIFFPSKENEDKLVKYFKMADNYCWVCIYTITNDRLARVLYTLKDAGVDVRIITDDETAHNEGSDVFKLANAGIPVRIDSDIQARMHHKFIVIDDDLLLNGSFNFTSTAVTKNFENVVAIDHPGLIVQFKTVIYIFLYFFILFFQIF
jgi:mitochondrial cardiolipin hydrolase